MKKTHVSIFVVLLLALLLLTATTAFAQADRTALSGTGAISSPGRMPACGKRTAGSSSGMSPSQGPSTSAQ